MARILIIEDEANIRRLLQYDLKQFNHVVDVAKDGKEGMGMALSSEYDVILIDWMLPHYSGLELTQKFREDNLDSIIIMVTAKDDEGDILDAFEAGVDDYMTKPFSPRELSARIKAHMRRYDGDSPQRIINEGNLAIDLDQHTVTVNDDSVDLTKIEFELLVYLVKNKNIALSRDQILNEIWNFDYDGDTRIVDVHIFKLRLKLEKSSIVINALRGIGYVAKSK